MAPGEREREMPGKECLTEEVGCVVRQFPFPKKKPVFCKKETNKKPKTKNPPPSPTTIKQYFFRKVIVHSDEVQPEIQ